MKKLQALVRGVTQTLHQSGQTNGIMLPVMYKYERITLCLIPSTLLCIFVEGMLLICSSFEYRCCPHVFLRLVEAIQNVDPYFHFKYDAVGRAGLYVLQKCVAAVHTLTYSLPADAVDEYVCIDESTPREALNHFCEAVINVFRQQ
jgi:hypothetical protein